MSNTKHTPGPWVSSPTHPREVRSTVVNGTAKRISLAVNNEAIGDEEAIANAKLIAAAPELLENEKTNLSTYQSLIFELTHGRIDYAIEILQRMISDTNEVIKKATE